MTSERGPSGRGTTSRRARGRRPEAARWIRLLRENASTLTFLGITLGAFVSRKFYVLPIAVAAMLLEETLEEGFEGDLLKPWRRKRRPARNARGV